MNDVSTLYICDRKACGEECPNQECKHTLDPGHAINFKPIINKKNGCIIAYEEKLEEKND